jgi:hypothetical protein
MASATKGGVMVPPARHGSGHPARPDLKSFMRGELSQEHVTGVVRHLLAGCARCRAITGELWGLSEGVPSRGTKLRPLSPSTWQGGV